ncbi:hypothetical protein D3C86_1939620 [compost metagenome]
MFFEESLALFFGEIGALAEFGLLGEALRCEAKEAEKDGICDFHRNAGLVRKAQDLGGILLAT